MNEKRGSERQLFSEIKPDPRILEVLKGKISDPIETISYKPGSEGQHVTVRLAKEGPGHIGLTDWKDNKEWSGIFFEHVLLTARYDMHLGLQLLQAGHNIHLQRNLNAMIVSHPGRRQSDEAWWYRDAVTDGEEKRRISNETLGLRLIQGKVPQDAFELVVALAHNLEGFTPDPELLKSWDYKLAVYVDHRTAQSYLPLNTRMGDFLLGNFFDRSAVTPELKDRVYDTMKVLIQRQKDFRMGKDAAQEITIDDADGIAHMLGAKPNSERLARKDLMKLILQDAETEADLTLAGIDPDAINEDTAPMPKWEHEIRKAYVDAAKESIVEEVNQRIALIKLYLFADGIVDESILGKLNEDFPINTRWGRYARAAFYEWYDRNSQEDRRTEDPGNDLVHNIVLSRFQRPEKVA